jgi:hypothetical protein
MAGHGYLYLISQDHLSVQYCNGRSGHEKLELTFAYRQSGNKNLDRSTDLNQHPFYKPAFSGTRRVPEDRGPIAQASS